MRVGLSGCGAVSQLYYGPALRRLEEEGLLTVVGLFDPDLSAAARVTSLLPSARTGVSFESLIELGLDLLIVASPPRFHAPQAIAGLEAGVPVHCEKPLALSAEEGRRMRDAAVTTGLSLSVGLMRRAFPAVRAISDMLERGILGPLRAVDVFEGGAFEWPVGSPGYFSQEESGGGVLRDIGPHALDLLTGWLGPARLRSYQDDSAGGVEANCALEITCGETPCTLRLSRDWARPNRFLFTGDRGWISWAPQDADQLQVGLGDESAGALTLMKPQPGQPFVLGAPEADFHVAFADGLREVVLGLGTAPDVSERRLGLDVLELIDRCYENREPMSEPWRDDDKALKSHWLRAS